ncbi:MAG: SAM-dependent methyltransferase [Prevotellaceae bacterium]|jgi:hypothetical protein|nr:SAM-dependent methyltransferase [Prevotellaceae bacterium]
MKENQPAKQVKSKKRVADHGEVFTPVWVVNDMLDLLPAEVWQPQKTFLEPACGEGAFLIEVYRRKLQTIKTEKQDEWEWQATIATSSIYGIELLEDNAKQCVKNLMLVFDSFYDKKYPHTQEKEVAETIQFLISRNIIQGNALTFRKCNLSCGNECSTCKEIVFSEWIPLENECFKRKDFTYKGIIDADQNRQQYVASLFEVEFSKEEHGLIKEYKPVTYTKIQYVEN